MYLNDDRRVLLVDGNEQLPAASHDLRFGGCPCLSTCAS
jgi:hypothetical protein